MTAFKFVTTHRDSVHEDLAVFAGRDRDHLGNCGRLTLRVEEADDLRALVQAGADPGGADVQVEDRTGLVA